MKLSVDREKKSIEAGDIILDVNEMCYLLTRDDYHEYRLVSMDGLFVKDTSMNELKWLIEDGIMEHFSSNEWSLMMIAK